MHLQKMHLVNSFKMSKEEKIREFRRLQEVAGLRESICELAPSIISEIKSVNEQFRNLKCEEQNLIRIELIEVLSNVKHMTCTFSHNLYIEMMKPIPGFTFPKTQL